MTHPSYHSVANQGSGHTFFKRMKW